MDLASLIAAQRFTPVRFAEAYDMDDVDSFLDALAAAAREGDRAALQEAARDLPDQRFATVRMSSGYDMAEVDAFLDDVLAPRLVEHLGGTVEGMSPLERAEWRLNGPGLVPARTGDRYDREQIDRGLAEARAALRGGGGEADDEARRMRGALEVLEAMRPESARGLRAGYSRAAVDALLIGATAILRGS